MNGTSVYIQSVYYPAPGDEPRIVDAGAVPCLSEVVQRPQDGWQYAVTATVKHGYVFRMKDGSLGRLFIDSWHPADSTVSYTRQYPY